jgi:hypothetical protein
MKLEIEDPHALRNHALAISFHGYRLQRPLSVSIPRPPGTRRASPHITAVAAASANRYSLERVTRERDSPPKLAEGSLAAAREGLWRNQEAAGAGRRDDMDTIEKFVCEQNVARYRTKLEAETDAARRSTMIRLLVAEESKFGIKTEQLASVDRHIARCRELITRQEALIGEMQSNGHDASRANALLETLVESLRVHKQYRATIRSSVDTMSA